MGNKNGVPVLREEDIRTFCESSGLRHNSVILSNKITLSCFAIPTSYNLALNVQKKGLDPRLKLSGHIFFGLSFLEPPKKFFFLSGQALTPHPPPPLSVDRPLKKLFFAASLSDFMHISS